MSKKVALVTGANRGIGYEISRQLGRQGYDVILACRSADKAAQAVKKLAGDGVIALACVTDVSNSASVALTLEFVKKNYGRLDVLVNNGGIFLDEREESSAFGTKVEDIVTTFETNTLGAFRLCQAFGPMMKKQGYGRIVNVSSGLGQLSEMNGGFAAYRISKTALNAVTRIFADELSDCDVLVNSVCPGWVKTDMGGPGADRPVEKGAETPVWLATLPAGGPTGGFFRDRESIDW